MNLPTEILNGILRINEDDYGTLYSCILVNKQWHGISIQILWRDPFYSEDTIKILINCLLAKDENFLQEHDIKLTFELLECQPLYNYARFATTINFIFAVQFYNLIQGHESNIDFLKERLLNFILDSSPGIQIFRKFGTDELEVNFQLIINHPRFDACFKNLHELGCNFYMNTKLLDMLTNTCKNINSIRIEGINYYKHKDNLAKLIEAQNQINQLALYSKEDVILSDNYKEAILAHAQSIIKYSSNLKSNLDSVLTPSFQNLKVLKLVCYSSVYFEKIKTITLPNIEEFILFTEQLLLPFVSDIEMFLENNGRSLKIIDICSSKTDCLESLSKLFQSIWQNCGNLQELSIFYRNQLNDSLIGLFNNCVKLRSIRFRKFSHFSNYAIDGDKILTVLNLTKPKNLKILIFEDGFYVMCVKTLSDLVEKWEGFKPLTIVLPKGEGSIYNTTILLLKIYQNNNFLNLIIQDFF